MLRILIGSGLALMALGFGAAGWQYWRGSTSGVSEPVPVAPAAPGGWLMSASGAPLPKADVMAYIAQDRFVPGRGVTILREAPLSALLADGESLPDPAFLEVMADIRAPMLAEGLCPALTAGFAAGCAVRSARVVEGSVNLATASAGFRIELVFRQKLEAAELPELAQHLFQAKVLDWPLTPAEGAAAEPPPADIETALAALAETALAGCGAEAEGLACRVTGLSLDWAPGRAAKGQARIGWLTPLGQGMIALPAIEPLPEG
jgi:hypothetical protein